MSCGLVLRAGWNPAQTGRAGRAHMWRPHLRGKGARHTRVIARAGDRSHETDVVIIGSGQSMPPASVAIPVAP